MSHSKRWLQEHHSDKFVLQARAEGYLSRAAYKLLEINKKDKLLKPGCVVVDLGAAPGGWTQVAAEKVGASGAVFALDRLPLGATPEGVEFVEGDFTEDAAYNALLDKLAGRKVDLVLSDLAPNMSGHKAVDQPAAMYLVELAAEFADKVLASGGSFLVKCFHGVGSEEYIKNMRKKYKQVRVRKPDASRARSPEFYLLCTGHILQKNSDIDVGG